MLFTAIPPLAMPRGSGGDRYNMLLPTQADDQGVYVAHMEQRRRFGNFTMLDNGIAEGTAYDWDDLQDIARKYMVNEMILPDVIGDMEATKDAVTNVLQHHRQPIEPWGYMGVVQGSTYDECMDMVRFYLDLGHVCNVRSIGLPRHLLSTVTINDDEHDPDGYDFIRLYLAQYIRNVNQYVDIHLLGTNPCHIKELQYHGSTFRKLGVRGVDTSAPYVYAHHGCLLSSNHHHHRQDNYFDMGLKDFNQEVLELNMLLMRAWCHG